jgi:hypothetical protein
MSEQISFGVCEHCQQQFGYWLAHCGFGDCVYAYCDSCGRTAILSLWDKRMPKLPNCPRQQEMCAAMEQYVKACECGGSFKGGESPRCPTATGNCQQSMRPLISRGMHPVQKRGGVGRKIGVGPIASSSKTNGLTTTFGSRAEKSFRTNQIASLRVRRLAPEVATEAAQRSAQLTAQSHST